MIEKDFFALCKNVRKNIIHTAFTCGKPSHIGGSLSMVETLCFLFANILRHNPKDPDWNQRDIFILSKGHAALGYFAVLHQFGYLSEEKLLSFQQNGSDLIAHPIKNISLGIESSNGSLGQGLSYGLGMAIGMTLNNQNRRVFVMLGDGECNEGSVWEAASLAGERKQHNLHVIVDYNKLRNDGLNTAYDNSAKLAAIWEAFGWNVKEIDGHNYNDIKDAFDSFKECRNKPKAIIANSIKGRGVDIMENNNEWHHNRVTESLKQELTITE